MKRTKKITKKFEQGYCVRAQPNTEQAYTLHYKLHIHENDHFNFATTDYVDGTDYIKVHIKRKAEPTFSYLLRKVGLLVIRIRE